MLNNYLKNLQQYNYDRKQSSSDENENNDDYLFLDTSTPILTITKLKSNTEELVGIQQKPQKVIDWFPIISIILAAIICLIAFIILCKRQIDHRRYIHHQIKRRENKRNKNNNQILLTSFDAAECIDGDMEFVAGLHIHLAKGNLTLNDNDAQMVS
ncbi:unnamed protein product [Rotaria sp. Silwood2]|nr:unnamed protein product [Rotaria sp. Silwood2]